MWYCLWKKDRALIKISLTQELAYHDTSLRHLWCVHMSLKRGHTLKVLPQSHYTRNFQTDGCQLPDQSKLLRTLRHLLQLLHTHKLVFSTDVIWNVTYYQMNSQVAGRLRLQQIGSRSYHKLLSTSPLSRSQLCLLWHYHHQQVSPDLHCYSTLYKTKSKYSTYPVIVHWCKHLPAHLRPESLLCEQVEGVVMVHWLMFWALLVHVIVLMMTGPAPCPNCAL